MTPRLRAAASGRGTVNLATSALRQGAEVLPLRPLRAAPSLAVALALALQPALASAASTVEVKVGRADGFSRIELHGAKPTSVRRDGRDLVVRFAKAGAPDMARLHVDPPPHVAKAELRTDGGAVELRLTPAADAEVRSGWADGATWINFAPASAGAASSITTPGADPRPADGVVRVAAAQDGAALRLRFPWRAPPAAAVFRRGDAVWVVFDAAAHFDLAAAPHGLPLARKVEAISGPGWSGVRIASPPSAPVSASADGATWIVTLGPAPGAGPEQVSLQQDEAGAPALSAHVAGARGVLWLTDPAVGDRIAAVPALPPAKGLVDAHAVVGAELLPSAQGLAVRAVADDLQVEAEGDLVRIGRPRGLALSPPGAQATARAASPQELPAAAAAPGFVDFAAWGRTGAGGWTARYDDLLARAAAESGAGRGASTAARMGLARFLVGSELGFEAIGVLNGLVRADARLAVDPEFRGLRGAARAMSGRWADAQADFSTPVTADDPASSLWRGYVAWRSGDMAGARAQFAAGRPALAAFAPKWRARFARAWAEAVAAGGDLTLARQALAAAPSGGLEPEEADGLELTAGRVAEAAGDRDGALRSYDAAGRSPLDAVAAPALLHAVQLRLQAGALTPGQAAAVLEPLRYRWRGDATELETVRTLARLDLDAGRYREALTVLRSAGGRSPTSPAAADLQADLQAAFKALFLDGRADGLQPIQALALFFDFKELTPIGVDGDVMVRRLVRRLVDVDLLDQAAELLRYQVDNRLDGVGRAQVATDLALVELMARKPEDALGALNDTRSTLLPPALAAQRRLVEARALLDLGRTEHALEVLGKDASPDAVELRALSAWRGHDWATAGRMAEARLGDRWRDGRPLGGVEAAMLLRAGTAYSLAGDDVALGRLRGRYAVLAERSGQPDALRVALAGLSSATPGEGLGAALAQTQSDAGAFAGWVDRMKARFREADRTPAAAPPVTKASAPTRQGPPAPKRA